MPVGNVFALFGASQMASANPDHYDGLQIGIFTGKPYTFFGQKWVIFSIFATMNPESPKHAN